jgi:hypothetical protein
MTSVLPHARVGQRKSTVDGDNPRASDTPRASATLSVSDAPSVEGTRSAGDVEDLDVESARLDLDEIVDDHALTKAESKLSEPKLSERQRSMIVFERQWWRHAGSKEQAIREQFDLSATRYYQMLNQLLDRPEALAFDPIVVGRLRRLRTSRARTRLAH